MIGADWSFSYSVLAGKARENLNQRRLDATLPFHPKVASVAIFRRLLPSKSNLTDPLNPRNCQDIG